jgi:hypothetical protein
MSVQRHFALAHEREELAQPGKNQFQSLAVVEMILIGYGGNVATAFELARQRIHTIDHAPDVLACADHAGQDIGQSHQENLR